MPIPPTRPLTIWRLTDGKPGHEKQTLGLARALLRARPGECFAVPVASRWRSLAHWLSGRFPEGKGLADPDLILAAGHATHPALLAARRARGGLAVVHMKPSLPLSLFDLCVIPEHDDPPLGPNVIPVRGVLNDVVAAGTHLPGKGLFLVGGASANSRWDDLSVRQAVAAIARACPDVAWTLTTSRRTPATFLADFLEPPGNLRLLPHTETEPGWLERALAEAGQVWVSEDSVSMLYEALTAGAAVGLLRLADARDSRVRRGVERLVSEGWVTPYERWRPGTALATGPGGFNESDRVAGLILDKLSHGQA